MVFKRIWFSVSLVLIGCLWGCSTMTPTVTPLPESLSSPLFAPTAEDAKLVVTLAHELDNRALHCLEPSTCKEVHFARGLVSLFESKEAARASFRRVIEDNPSSSWARSSMLWLALIGDERQESAAEESQQITRHLMAQFVRDWMARELAEYTKHWQIITTTQKARLEPAEAVQALQRQVRERDRHIATLESKLEALKVIDQDYEGRKRTIKVPATLP